MAWTDIKSNVWDRISGILLKIRTKGVQGTRHLHGQGVEVAGLNGRFVYLRWDDRVLIWEAYENDGATILKGRAAVDSIWEPRVDRMLHDVLLEFEDRVARIAKRLEDTEGVRV